MAYVSKYILTVLSLAGFFISIEVSAQIRKLAYQPRPRPTISPTVTPTPTPTSTPIASSTPPPVVSTTPAFTNLGPFTVGKKANIIYGSDYTTTGTKVDLKMDIYYPVITTQPLPALPVIVFIHGGGWSSGSKDGCYKNDTSTPNLCAGQPARGYIVVSIDYRLSSQALFPAQIQDVKAAIRYLRKNANSDPNFKIDGTRIAAMGNSAGGHLAALLGTSVGQSNLEGTINLGYDSSVQAVASYYGPTDLLQMDTQLASSFPSGSYLVHNSSTSPESKLLGCTLNGSSSCNALADTANPITYVNRYAPPFILRHGNADNIVPYQQSSLLDSALKLNGAYSDIRILNQIGHSFSLSKCTTTSTCNTDIINAYKETIKFFDQVLRGF